MKHYFSAFLFLIVSSITFSQSPSKFSKEDISADFEYLYSSLDEAHYDLFAYTPKQEFDTAFNMLKKSISQDSLTLLETTNLFQKLISKSNNGHTNIDFPIQSYIQYAQSGGTLFPFEVAFEYDRALVRKNWSENDSIKIGAEVVGINGVPMPEILSQIYPQISAERPYFKNTKIEMYSFPRLYWQVFGKQDVFEVDIRTDGEIQQYTLKAIGLIEDFEMKREEVLNASMQLKFFENAAYLNPGNFSGDEAKYQRFIDSAFVEINQKKMQNLIIDLRNNGGGDDSFSDYMVAYFADKPFKWNSSFTLKTSQFLKDHVQKKYDTTQPFWKSVVSHENGEIYDYPFEAHQPQPEEKRFHGQVYVLANRQSHSQSAVTAAQIQDYGFGTIVGEETGDYPSLYASIFQYQLPNTRISVNVSKGKIVRVNGSTQEEGVIPDIFIKDYLLDEEDEVLDGLLEKINNKS
ncbi:S41 family peptidase [Flagellimonas meishanensis]|uniref:S41 family peptidase n=1 Tax=Flagellimonas meishanensis TaxID=2873264 RepID=UPI001CA731D2|nr:S41 family peptidase [[Muricauda] meishanensis]